ncbi:MAG: hypothetical protein ACREJO_10595 [Phycisphaerales bacterium]
MSRSVLHAFAAAVLFALALPHSVCGQSPIQWGGNARTAIDQAKQQSLPLLFWITDWTSAGVLEGNELENAQEEAFRDPTIVAIAKHCYIAIRVSRNSRVIEECKELGLPTNFGRYIAIVSPDGKLLAQIDPGEVATPEHLVKRMAETYVKYCDDLYVTTLKPIITSRESKKDAVRTAVQTIWRLHISAADADLVALCDRPDVTQSERAKLYMVLASLPTKVSINALLDRAGKGDRDAVQALSRAEAPALEFLLSEMPTAEGPAPSERQMAAYTAAAKVCGVMARADSFWKNAKPTDRTFELDQVIKAAGPTLNYWKTHEGRWR